jgi:hypothetical protein
MPWHGTTNSWRRLPHAVTRYHKLLAQATTCRDTVSEVIHEISYVPHSSQFPTDEVLFNCGTLAAAQNKAYQVPVVQLLQPAAYVVISAGYVPVSTCLNTKWMCNPTQVSIALHYEAMRSSWELNTAILEQQNFVDNSSRRIIFIMMLQIVNIIIIIVNIITIFFRLCICIILFVSLAMLSW